MDCLITANRPDTYIRGERKIFQTKKTYYKINL